jgi:beta-mannosidase
MNDNFPAASWACIDWYGVPKIGHYFFQDSFAPLHAVVIFSRLNFAGTPVELPVFLLDDTNALRVSQWEVIVRAYDNHLYEVKKVVFSGEGSIQSPMRLGTFPLTFEETDSSPLLTVVEVVKDGQMVDRTFYWTNYEMQKGSLFTLPKTTLKLETMEGRATVMNMGDIPAVAVNVSQPGHLDTFTIEDNYFWLDPGETKTVVVNVTDNLVVSAWNAI